MRAVAASFFLGLMALAVPAAAQTTSAQTWPQRPVTFIVSQSAGASPDVMARMIATKLAAPLGQQVIIENKPGAGAMVGSDYVAKSKPDGYTFLVGAASIITNSMTPIMHADAMGFSYDKEIVPVSRLADFPSVVMVRTDAPADNLVITASGKLVLATDVGVFTTTPGSTSWARLGSGLPNSPVNDLSFGPGNTYLIAATHGRGLWKISTP